MIKKSAQAAPPEQRITVKGGMGYGVRMFKVHFSTYWKEKEQGKGDVNFSVSCPSKVYVICPYCYYCYRVVLCHRWGPEGPSL